MPQRVLQCQEKCRNPGIHYLRRDEDTDFFARPYKDIIELSKLMAQNCRGLKWACMGRLDRIIPKWPPTKESQKSYCQAGIPI